MSIIVIIKYLYETYLVLVIDICYIVNFDPLFKNLIKVSGATARWPFTDSAVPSSLLLLLLLLFFF